MAEIIATQLKIGMEVHVELATRAKLLTGAASVAHPDHFDAEPNSLVDAYVLALPGTLPVMNRRAVEYAVMVGLALDCDIAEFSTWDRKNYFYPDLPKGFQISQYDLPLCFGGEMVIERADGECAPIGIRRAHLEEDAGKLSHELPGGLPYDGSLVDLNRAGTPLLEIVTEPDLQSTDDAVTFARELRNICRFLGVTEGIMQRGHMRFEPNINLSIRTADGHRVATPIVEVKNLNSFRALKNAIEYEESRQLEAWKETGECDGPGMKSTRGWDERKGETFIMRAKEDAHDYRYFPEPDLPPVEVTAEWRESIRASIPELPRERFVRYRESYEIAPADARALVGERDLCFFFEACLDAAETVGGRLGSSPRLGQVCSKFILNTLSKLANERGCEVHELGLSPHQVASVLEMRESNRIGSSSVEPLLSHLVGTDADPAEVAAAHALLQVRDEAALEQWVDAAIRENAASAQDYAAGKDAAIGRLVGAVMKQSAGRADAREVRAMLEKKLRDLGRQ